MANIFIGMETSGQLRRRFAALGHDVISCDLLPSEDASNMHAVGDVFETLDRLCAFGWWPDLAIFHITCTYLTGSAEWAYKDPDFIRYPGVGYHQKLKPDTLTGAQRREAREKAMNQFRRVYHLPIKVKIIENPVGALSRIRKPSQIVQPYQFGDDASKKTCFWYADKQANPLPAMCLPIIPELRCDGRWVEWPRGSGKLVERWSNQTDSNQNNKTPEDDRWKDRSRTFPGLADVAAQHWSTTLARLDAAVNSELRWGRHIGRAWNGQGN